MIEKSKEVTVVDQTTGGMKGQKGERFSLIPFDWLWAMARHYGFGASKYDDNNWRKGYNWSLTLDAHSRHVAQWVMGEDVDEESGSHHLIAAAWHLIALWWFQKHGRGTDNVRETTKLVQTSTVPPGIDATRAYVHPTTWEIERNGLRPLGDLDNLGIPLTVSPWVPKGQVVMVDERKLEAPIDVPITLNDVVRSEEPMKFHPAYGLRRKDDDEDIKF